MKINIRPAVPEDVEALRAIYNHYITHSPATFDLEPKSADERRNWFRQFADAGAYRLLVAQSAQEVIGYAYSGLFKERAAYASSIEVSVYLHPRNHAQGVGSRLYSRLFAELEAEYLHRAYAGITLPNDGSVALHKKFGFEQVGHYREVGRKFGRYWDVAWFEKALD